MAGAPQGNFNQQAAQGMQAAQMGSMAGMGYQPMSVRAPIAQGTTYNAATMGNVPQVQAGQLASTNLSAYTNPYESQVVQGLQQDALRGQQMASNQLGAQATAAGAFGGSRHGVAEGQMASDIQRNLMNQVAGLRQSGFQNAQQMALSDIGNRMQAGLANQGAGMQAGLANINALNQAGQFGASTFNNLYQANQQAIMQAQLANQNAGLAGAQQRLGSAGQLANISGNMFGQARQAQQDLAQVGLQQQVMQQALIDAAKGQYAGYTGAPAQSTGFMNAALGVTPMPQTTTTGRNPGLFDYLTLGATAYGGGL